MHLSITTLIKMFIKRRISLQMDSFFVVAGHDSSFTSVDQLHSRLVEHSVFVFFFLDKVEHFVLDSAGLPTFR